MKQAILLLSALAVIFAVAYVAYITGYLQFNAPSREQYPVRGIDVSNHQGVIGWDAVRQDGISFAYIKATEGGDWKDKSFQKNWDDAMRAGLSVGAYHFFTLCKDGIAQAKNFISIVPIAEGVLAPAIDLEYLGNCSARPSKEEFLKELNDFVQEIQVYYMKKPVLYTNYDFYEHYLAGTSYADYPIWMSNIVFEPDYKKYPSIAIWQYTHNGRVNGIDGPVDVNTYVPACKGRVCP